MLYVILFVLMMVLHYFLASWRIVFRYSSKLMLSLSKAFFTIPMASSSEAVLQW